LREWHSCWNASEGRPERNAEIAAEFVRMKVDVIVTNTTAARTVKQATSVIPIVFPLGIDPVGGGLIGSLAQPGGNVTGMTNQQSELAGKRLDLLREVLRGSVRASGLRAFKRQADD
jgi:putative ABC transport system substrate-binding protein